MSESKFHDSPEKVLVSNKGAVYFDTVEVDTAGEPVQLSDQVIPDGYELAIGYHPDNTGRIFIAESEEEALSTGTKQWILTPGMPGFCVKVSNASLIWVNSTVSGDKVMLGAEIDPEEEV